MQQDHDSFVKIKAQTEKELQDEINMQSGRELAVNEALQQKADLRLNRTKQAHVEALGSRV